MKTNIALTFVIVAVKLVPVTGLAMDLARVETGVDRACAEFNLSGQGILVTLMDRGIDWKNNDFRNEDGSTRIEAILDLTDDRGAGSPANPYHAGTLYTKEQINEAISRGTELRTRDALGHGTTTAGIACGNGRNSPGRKYRGIAPKASILVVKICGENVPAHGKEPAEKYYWNPARLSIAVDFARDEAHKLRMPCVMVLNIGSQGGPTDGRSSFCRKIDETVGPGKPGFVFVTGPGDEGTHRKSNRTTVVYGRVVPVGTIWDAASAFYNICPGDYVHRTHWTDIDGVFRSHDTEGKDGEIWQGSSVGPTADGRFGIDCCAPGDSVFTTYNPKSYWATFRFNLIEDGKGLYGRASAVSAANPLTGGIIALMLQANPRLDAAAVKRILQQTARSDPFTGKTPNMVWGHGKVDAYAAIKAARDLAGKAGTQP